MYMFFCLAVTKDSVVRQGWVLGVKLIELFLFLALPKDSLITGGSLCRANIFQLFTFPPFHNQFFTPPGQSYALTLLQLYFVTGLPTCYDHYVTDSHVSTFIPFTLLTHYSILL